MRKFLVFPDGGEFELTPLTYKEFVQIDRYVGGSDIAWVHFLRVNGFHDLDDFDEEGVKKMEFKNGRWELIVKIRLEPGEPNIDWSRAYGRLMYENGKWVDPGE